MNVSDGGKQPHMRDTVWRGRPQRMVMDGGLQKGMKRVLQERGLETKGMNADKMREELKKFEVLYTCLQISSIVSTLFSGLCRRNHQIGRGHIQ